MTGPARVLVAGIGNIFLGDDGFGVEVVRRLAGATLPEAADVGDYGIRGVHLAYDLLDGRYATVILVDACPAGDEPGTLSVVEAVAEEGEDAAARPGLPAAPLVDAHAMTPEAVLAALTSLGGRLPRVLVAGCEPAVLGEGVGLSPAVAAVLGDAVAMVSSLARREVRRLAAVGAGDDGRGCRGA